VPVTRQTFSFWHFAFKAFATKKCFYANDCKSYQMKEASIPMEDLVSCQRHKDYFSSSLTVLQNNLDRLFLTGFLG
jgi:hypothetical protein